MDEKQMKWLVRGYMYASCEQLEEDKNAIAEIKDDPLFLEFLTKRVANKTFRMIVDEFDIPDSVVEERENLERNIINNYQQYPVDVVRQALCDLLFHDNLNNVLLNIDTMKKYAECSKEFAKEYEKLSAVYDVVCDFLSINESDVTIDTMELVLGDLCEMQKVLAEGGIHLPSATSQLFSLAEKLCEKGFRDDVAECGNRLFDGIEPETVVSGSGKEVKMLRLAKQTPNQEKFLFFARSTYVDKSYMGDDAKNAYVQTLKAKGDYLSYSLFDQSKHASFIKPSERSVVFGYFSLGGGSLLSTTIRDAQTNQFTVCKGKYNIKQNFLSSSKFMEATKGKYNELVCENEDMPLPDFIISATPDPNNTVIEIANAMNIPIVFIDDTCYDISPIGVADPIYFDNDPMLKIPLAEMESMSLSQ